MASNEIRHPVKCDECGGETFMFEKYCHLCGTNRWDDDE